MAQCSERIYGPGRLFRGEQCSKTAKVIVNGKNYCTVHDPERIKARAAKAESEWKAKFNAEKAARESAAKRLTELARDAARYRWLRLHPAWETESFLGGLSPEEFDAEVDRQMAVDP